MTLTHMKFMTTTWQSKRCKGKVASERERQKETDKRQSLATQRLKIEKKPTKHNIATKLHARLLRT